MLCNTVTHCTITMLICHDHLYLQQKTTALSGFSFAIDYIIFAGSDHKRFIQDILHFVLTDWLCILQLFPDLRHMDLA